MDEGSAGWPHAQLKRPKWPAIPARCRADGPNPAQGPEFSGRGGHCGRLSGWPTRPVTAAEAVTLSQAGGIWLD